MPIAIREILEAIEIITMGPILFRGTSIAKRPQILVLAHEDDRSMSVMKRRLRAKVCWPMIDRYVEQHDTTSITGMGPLPNQEHVLVVIDYYLRFQDVQFLKTISSTSVIKCLTELFARFGIPNSIRSDNRN